jgi:hypothetical protein
MLSDPARTTRQRIRKAIQLSTSGRIPTKGSILHSQPRSLRIRSLFRSHPHIGSLCSRDNLDNRDNRGNHRIHGLPEPSP